MPHDDTPADFHTRSHRARRRAGGEVRRRSIPSLHPRNREDVSSREEAREKGREPHDEMPSAEGPGEHEHAARPLPPKPKRALLRHFSLSYTIVLLIAMGFVVAGATWVVIVTPRWLSEDSLAGDLSPEAQQVLEAVATSTATTTLAVSGTTTPATTTPSVTPQKPRVRITETETGWLNVREGPSTTYRRLRQVLPGETYPFTEVRDGWYRIELGDGEYGWVSGTYVEELGAR
ncbi:MAG: hypothetical protein KatS3mg099_025 [Candidatus Parcubacteria bacterium]|nr:MAG: hypothetical protein KatS3mg099_025 [Candidatus Parcubacteria bacterium]